MNETYPADTEVSVKCNDGYTVNGYHMSTCIDGKWDPPPAICIPSDQGQVNY